MSLFQLGDHQFISFSLVPTIPRPQLAIEARSGVAGETVWNTGSRGEPVRLLAVRDAVTVGDALDLFRTYQELIGGDPLTLTWADSPFNQYKFIVLNVMDAGGGIHAIVGGRGGISGQNGLSRGMIRTQWELLPVDSQLQ